MFGTKREYGAWMMMFCNQCHEHISNAKHPKSTADVHACPLCGAKNSLIEKPARKIYDYTYTLRGKVMTEVGIEERVIHESKREDISQA